MRVLPRYVQQHVQLTMTESSTFNEIRDRVIAFERVSSSWTKDRVLLDVGAAPLGAVTSYNAGDGGSIPMEINAVMQYLKGKGKGKYPNDKGKGKGKQNEKGKGKSKGKQSEKGKGKSTGKGYADGGKSGFKGKQPSINLLTPMFVRIAAKLDIGNEIAIRKRQISRSELLQMPSTRTTQVLALVQQACSQGCFFGFASTHH